MVKAKERKSSMVVSRGDGEGNGEFKGYRASVCQDEKVLEICGMALRMYLTLPNCKF